MHMRWLGRQSGSEFDRPTQTITLRVADELPAHIRHEKCRQPPDMMGVADGRGGAGIYHPKLWMQNGARGAGTPCYPRGFANEDREDFICPTRRTISERGGA